MRNLKTPQDIRDLPSYVPKVDPEATPLNRVVDSYYIRPDIQCALCGKWHNEGFIVELVDKSLTNIGHICGGKFGEKFDEERRKYSEFVRRPQLLKKLTAAITVVSGMSNVLISQRNRADAIQLRKSNFAIRFPALYRHVVRMATNNQAVINESIERSKDEIDDALATNPYQSRDSLRIKEIYRGTVSGFKLPILDFSLSTGVRRTFADADRFVELTPRTMTMQELTKWSNWYDDFDQALAAASAAIEQGEEFFTSANFNLFCHLPGTSEFHPKLKALRATDLDVVLDGALPDGPVPGSHPKSSGRRRSQSTLTSRETRRLTGNKKMR